MDNGKWIIIAACMALSIFHYSLSINKMLRSCFISGAKIVNIVESTIIYQLIKYCTAILFRGYYL